MSFSNPYHISPNQLPPISPQIHAQLINYQNEVQTWPNYPEMISQYQKYKILPHYPSNNIQSSHFAHFSDLNKYNRNNFFPQTVYNSNRVQNYIPQNVNPDTNLLSNPNLYIPKENNKFDDNFQYDNNFALRNEALYQDYNKNHLSDLFDLENIPTRNSYKYKRKLFKIDKEKHKKMLELNKERYSLKETLKKLDIKFDQGIISEVDYFKTFKNLQKEIYLIEKKIQDLQDNLHEVEEIKNNSRNFDNRRFYT